MPGNKRERVPERFQDMLDFVEALRNEGDRAAVITGAAYIDAFLTEVLEHFFVNDPEVVGPLLGGWGAFASFGARVRLAYCLGLINQQELDDLQTIQSIRNQFAHTFAALDLSEPALAAKCLQLSHVEPERFP